MNNYYLIIDAANYLKVSTATIKNWIKAHYLIYDHHNGIKYNSIINFKQNITNLKSRANKSNLDHHNQ